MEKAVESQKKTFKPVSQRAHRALAVQMLYAIDRTDFSLAPSELADNLKQNYGLDITTEDFAFKLVENVLAKNALLESLIAENSKNWRSERIGCLTKIVLKIAMAEIICNFNPPPVVIDQGVELAKDFCEKDAHKFINGILDNFAKSSNCANTK